MLYLETSSINIAGLAHSSRTIKIAENKVANYQRERPSAQSMLFDEAFSLPKPKDLAVSLVLNFHLPSLRLGALAFSLISGRGRTAITRAQRRRLMNRRRRWFVDNIIMHHRRLHDKNRETIVNATKNRILEKKKQQELPALQKRQTWQERMDTRKRAKEIKGRIDARRLRARSRWISVFEEKKD